MTAANPKAPFAVEVLDTYAWLRDGDEALLATFYGPDRQARAEALAAEYEQTYGPEWVVGHAPRRIEHVSGEFWMSISGGHKGEWMYEHDLADTLDAYADHICRLLNEHGGPQ